MLSTIRPIIYKLTGLTLLANQYLAYTLSLEYADGVGSTDKKKIYYGKTFVDSNGNTDIRVDQVLKDFLFKWETSYNLSNQTYRPEMFGTLSDSRSSIEETYTEFWNCVVVLQYEYNSIQTTEDLNVCGAWVPPFQKMGPIYDPMTTADPEVGVQNYATLATSILPQMPPISTSNFWMAWLLNVNRVLTDNSGTLEIGCSDWSRVDITNLIDNAGTYANAIPLQELISEILTVYEGIDGGDSDSLFDNTIDGGYSDSVYDDTIDGGDSNENYQVVADFVGAPLYLYWTISGNTYSAKIAQFDICAHRYYVSWVLPTGGWACQPFEGNVKVGTNNTQSKIVNFYDSEEVVANSEQPTFDLWKGNCKKDMYAHLLTMLASKSIYVYDTEQDRGWYCTPNTNTGATLPTKTGKLSHFNVELKAINANEQ